MKLKVCGIHPNKNDLQLVNHVNYLGFIFYEKSKRYVSAEFYHQIKEIRSVKKIGVFVNESFENIQSVVKECGLDKVQLHGDESPELCAKLKKHLPVIKAIAIKQKSDLAICEKYQNSIDYFLFDTKGPLPGGNGYAFDWQLLKDYDGEKPFFLSGGIALDDVDKINKIGFEKMYGVDVNSKFESEPGVKILEDVKCFSEMLSK